MGSTCRRDLEDFTRLHILVNDSILNLPDVTCHMKFENVKGNPSVNLFKAVHESDRYLWFASIADNQLKETRLATVTTDETEIKDIQTDAYQIKEYLENRLEGYKGLLERVLGKAKGISDKRAMHELYQSMYRINKEVAKNEVERLIDMLTVGEI